MEGAAWRRARPVAGGILRGATEHRAEDVVGLADVLRTAASRHEREDPLGFLGRHAAVLVADVGELAEGNLERDGVSLALFNAGDGHFYACSPVCPHEDGPLAEGWLEGNAVVCPWHGYDFDLTSGACRVTPDFSVKVYPVRVSGTAVEVDLA